MNYRNNSFLLSRDGVIKLIGMFFLCCFSAFSLMVSVYINGNLLNLNGLADLGVVIPWTLIITLVVSVLYDCYNFSHRYMYYTYFSLCVTTFISSLIVLVLPFVIVEYPVSKKVMFAYCILQLFTNLIWALVMRIIAKKIIPPLQSILICNNENEYWLKGKILFHSSRYNIIKTISPDYHNLETEIDQSDAVIIDGLTNEQKRCIAKLCAKKDKPLLLKPDYTDIMMINSETEQFDDLLMVSVKNFGISGGQQFVKRCFDLFVGFLGSVVSTPVILLLALIIFLEDGKNPFFAQKRLTRGGEPYMVFKMRTMIHNAESEVGAVLATKNDARITKVGRLIRPLRLDELPQFYNILIGQMSIVGPRPERPEFYEQLDSVLPEFRHRLAVKAGLTGFAQVWGKYSTDMNEKLMMDLMYIQNYSMALDLKLFIETFRVAFSKGAAEGVDDKQSKDS